MAELLEATRRSPLPNDAIRVEDLGCFDEESCRFFLRELGEKIVQTLPFSLGMLEVYNQLFEQYGFAGLPDVRSVLEELLEDEGSAAGHGDDGDIWRSWRDDWRHRNVCHPSKLLGNIRRKGANLFHRMTLANHSFKELEARSLTRRPYRIFDVSKLRTSFGKPKPMPPKPKQLALEDSARSERELHWGKSVQTKTNPCETPRMATMLSWKSSTVMTCISVFLQQLTHTRDPERC